MATVTFSEQNSPGTKRGWPLNLCRVPESWGRYDTYVSDVII